VTAELPPGAVDALAQIAGLTVPEEDREILVGVFTNQLAAARLVESLDLGDVEPIVTFDPRWT
jgi:hypothetical protein